MDEQEHLLKIIHRRGKSPVLLLLSLLPFVYAYVNFETRAFGPFGAGLILSVIISALMAHKILRVSFLRQYVPSNPQ